MDIDVGDGMDLVSAARALGVHYQTAYRWVRDGVLPAERVGMGYRLRPADVEALAQQRRAHQPLCYTGRRRDWDRLQSQLHGALVAGDETGARRVFERIRLARVPLLDQCEQLLAPVVHRIGDELSLGTIAAAQVRLAAGLAERSLAWYVGCLPSRAWNTILVITPEGDAHRLPPLMATAVLREAGWGVHQISDLPTDGVVAAARRLRPVLAVVSATLDDAAEAAAELRARLQAEASVPVLTGGRGERLGQLVEDAAALATALPGGPSRRPAR